MKLFKQGTDIFFRKDGICFRAVVQHQTFRFLFNFLTFYQECIIRKKRNELFILRIGTVKLLPDERRGQQGESQTYDDDREKTKFTLSSHNTSQN